MSEPVNSPESSNLLESLFQKHMGGETASEEQATVEDTDSPEVEAADTQVAEEVVSEDQEELNAAEESEETETNELPPADLATPNDSENSASDIETVKLKQVDENGRNLKLKINYSDRKAIKDAFIKAAGMRKFQKERDTARSELKTISEEFETFKKDYNALDKAFTESGVKGVVELLGGNWQEAVDEELSEREYINGLSSDERYELELKKRDERYQKELEAERRKREEFQGQITEREEKAAQQELESKLHPAFERYRFAGQLGDPSAENRLDKDIWREVMDRISEYPEDVNLTQSLIDKEFRTVANEYRKFIKVQTEKRVKKEVDTKKADTMKRAQVAAKKGLNSTTAAQKMLEHARSGNLRDAFSLWKNGS